MVGLSIKLETATGDVRALSIFSFVGWKGIGRGASVPEITGASASGINGASAPGPAGASSPRITLTSAPRIGGSSSPGIDGSTPFVSPGVAPADRELRLTRASTRAKPPT